MRWSPACATVFAALKDALTSAPVLVLPNLDARLNSLRMRVSARLQWALC